MLKLWAQKSIKEYSNNIPLSFDTIWESGGRGSGKTRGCVEFALYFLTKFKGIRFLIVKTQGTELDELWTDMVHLLQDVKGININDTKKRIKLPNGNLVKMYSINPQFLKHPKVGLSTFINYKATILLYDEVYSLPEFIIKNFNLSVRSGDQKNHQVITLYTFNPWNKSNPHVAYFRHHLKENEKLLLTKGIQIQEYPEKKAIFIRTNYRWGQFLSERDIREIEAEKLISYRRWKVLSLGMDGANEGGIFETSLPEMRAPITNFDYSKLSIGIDWGDSVLKAGGKNVAVAVMMNLYQQQIEVVDDNLLDNSLLRWNDTQLMMNQIKWCSNIAKKYNRDNVTVWIDNASHKSFYEIWQNLAHQMNITNLNFQPITNTYKVQKVPIQLRIDIINFLISNKQMSVAKPANAVMEALEGMYYETSNNNPDKWVASHYLSDAFAALCYGISYDLLQFQPTFLYQNSLHPKSAFNMNRKDIRW